MDLWPLNKKLWKKVPTIEDVLHLVHIFGFRDLEDSRPLTRNQMKSERIFENFLANQCWMKEFYMNCKRERYFHNIENEPKKIITIFRHFLKEIGYQFIAEEKSIDSKKVLVYHLQPMKIDQCFDKQKWVIEDTDSFAKTSNPIKVEKNIFWVDLSSD